MIKNKVDTPNKLQMDQGDSIDNIETHLNTLMADVSTDGKLITNLLDNNKIIDKQLTNHFNIIQSILPLTDPGNLVIFLGEIVTNTNNTNSVKINTEIINNIAKHLNEINQQKKTFANITKAITEGISKAINPTKKVSTAESGEGDNSFNTRSQRYLK